MRFLQTLSVAVLAAQAAALNIGGRNMVVKKDSDGLQDIVTYDEHSLMVYGERIFVYSGEFHAYRLPVPDLWLDIFQKVKALGFSAVSFYTDFALLEGQPGVYNASGIFALEPFFDAASQAGIYIIARPGPYINAESSGGGYPGWFQRVPGLLRTRDPSYLNATDLYVASVSATIAKYQITNGGPVILLQPENEYSQGIEAAPVYFPDPVYFSYVENQYREAGIVVPFISNDAYPHGYFAPGSEINGTALGDVDIYGHDSYPLGFDCANPYTWPSGDIPTYFHEDHEEQSPSTFFSINEFQGGSFDPWGGLGFAQCEILLNYEFERVFFKNDYAAGATLLNLYMIYGGTNWGNLGHAGGYTSYDYGAAIAENRELYREKYSEIKLQANFLRVTPAYLTASVGNLTNGTFASTDSISTTPLSDTESASSFYIVRHTDYQQLTSQNYTMTLNTSQGVKSIPQLGGSLTLSGRDSKWHVTDYDVGGTTLLYSTAEIFTWQTYDDKTALVVYGGPGELHEISVATNATAKTIEGSGVITKSTNGSTILNWVTSPTRRVVQVGNLFVYLLDRNTAYNYWTADLPRTDAWGNYTSNLGNRSSVIIEAGYLVRGAYVDGSALYISGDLNATVPLKVIGTPSTTTSYYFNGAQLNGTTNNLTGEFSSTISYTKPSLDLPDLTSLSWSYLNDLPEASSSYDDSAWTLANLTQTYNSAYNNTTPVSLFASDYGYHTGVLLFRGTFVSTGTESTFYIRTQGGSAFGSSVFLNSTYIGSWPGIDADADNNSTYTLPNLKQGEQYVLTVVVDNNGLDESGYAGTDGMKAPRGILDYSLSGHDASDISWKLTGNLGGENYVDKVRGPLNEGGLFAERQGFTQPYPPYEQFEPVEELSLSEAGVGFFAANFTLDLPKGYDVPLFLNFGNSTTEGNATSDYRAQLWVNGYQFGKYVNNVGPQTSFPVPQGILDYYGINFIAVELWAQQASGATLTNFSLTAGTPVLTSYKAPENAPMPAYAPREGAY